MFPHAEHERVPVVMNFVYALFVPWGVLILWLLATRASLHKHHVTYLSFLTSVLLASFLTDIIKNAVGRPRPDLISRCKPVEGTQTNVLVSIDVCTETGHHILHDGWRSFPSGHSSFSFSGLGYLALFFAGQLGIFKHGGGDLARSLVCLSPLLGALMIAISRCEDYRHDVYDVTAGSILGFSVAYWSYHRFWHKLRSRDCHEPLPPPSDDMAGYGRLVDEEEGGVPSRHGAYEMTVLPR
ncbi:pap2 superfamily protein [Zalerion maritima]|uniref:Pap2 superfamily protein n=1 Tax=Zalerion maritima TaxID=339359 RepID=A0AAD5WSZ3_9PEZI|nr:pap2 superfamily protein [Zalerion maritima]